MTLVQAEEQRDALNQIIELYAGTIRYYVFAEWNSQFEKEYSVTLLPYKYDTEFVAGDYSIQLAFARVALKALVTNYADAEAYVTNYDVLIPEDEELNNYLNPK